ncbi:MAG: zinc-dependent metalloprotease [Actinomycetota bacterium]
MSDDRNDDQNPFGDNPFGGFPFGNLGDLSGLFGGAGGDPWASARQIAASVANGGSSESNVDPAERIAFEQLARVAELQVTSATGLSLSDGTPPLIRPATRQEWAHATLDAWRPLLETMSGAFNQGMVDPSALSDQGLDASALGFGADFMAQIMKMMGPMMLSMMAGSMVGHLARNNLGSYDLPLARPDARELLVVHANVAAFTDEWSVPTDDMRLWICLHEYLHHAVLRIPHVRERITRLTSDYVGAFESNSQALTDQLGGIDPSNPESLSSLEGLMNDPEALMGVVQSERQRAMLPEISAMLAAIVGWVDHMMDRIGGQLIGSYSMLSEALRRRRVTADPTDRFLERMIGLELDQACYDRGRAFIDGVVERGGEDALQRLWANADDLPTPNDIVAPGLWLARIGVEMQDLDLSDLGALDGLETLTGDDPDPDDGGGDPPGDG